MTTPQVLSGGFNSNCANNYYNSIVAGYNWGSSVPKGHIVSTSGRLSNFCVRLAGSPGAGASYTFTVFKNSVAQSLAVTIADANTQGMDNSHSISVSAWDVICIKCTTSGAPTARIAYWSMVFVGSMENEIICLTSFTTDSSQTTYGPMQSSKDFGNGSNTENILKIPWPTAGTFKKLYVVLTSGPAPAYPTRGYKFVLRKGAVSQSLTCSILGSNTTGSDTSNSFHVNAGDLVDVRCEVVDSTPTASPTAHVGFVFVPDVAGEAVLSSAYDGDPNSGINYYQHVTVVNYNYPWNSNEVQKYQGMQVGTLKKLYAYERNGGTMNLTLRRETASSTLVVAVAASSVSSDLLHTVACSNYDRIDVMADTQAANPLLNWALVVTSSLPAINSVSPDHGLRGESTVAFTLIGVNFTGATAVSFGADISVDDFSVDSDTQITGHISIAPGASAGLRTVSVTTPSGTCPYYGGFTVDVPMGNSTASKLILTGTL